MGKMANDDSFSRREGRGERRSGRDRSPLNRSRTSRNDCRIFVSNLPYEYRWQDLKDLLRREVAEVAFVELFTDEHDKPKGCGIVEFETPDSVKKAIDKLHRFDIDGRKIIVKEDYGAQRDKYGNLTRNRDRDHAREDNRNSHWDGNRDSGNKPYVWGETYGLSPSFLEGLNISPPLVSRVFVANLDYKVTDKKLREVFKLAGKVRDIDLSVDADGKSRGFAVVEFDHPVESVQAISMLHNQQLYDRRLTVRMDRVDPQERDRLPDGLVGVGMGLGQNGAPLKDVARNLPNSTSNALPVLSNQNSLASLTAASALSAAAPPLFPGLGSSLQAAAGLTPATASSLLPTNSLDLIGRGGELSLRDLAFGGLPGLNSSLGASLGSGLTSNSSGMGNSNSNRDSYDRNSSMRNNDSGQKSSDTIVIDNLPMNFTWQSLKDKCRDAGDIKFAEMRGKLGLVRYASDWEALRAVNSIDDIQNVFFEQVASRKISDNTIQQKKPNGEEEFQKTE